jgi:hypothetical protein
VVRARGRADRRSATTTPGRGRQRDRQGEGCAEIEYTVSSSANIDEHLIGAFGVKAQTDVALTLKAAEVRQEDLIDGKKRKGKTPEQALAQTQP